MRFSTILLGAFAALVSAQSTSGTATSDSVATTSSSSAASTSAAEPQIEQCIKACALGDVSCTSKCIAVPDPSASQVNQTNNCVAACPKGSGSASDNLNYSNCIDACVGKFYFTSGGTPSPTGASDGGSGSGNGSGSSGAATQTSGSAGASGSSASKPTTSAGTSGTQTASAAATSSGAGEALRVGGTAVGLFGFFAAVFAI